VNAPFKKAQRQEYRVVSLQQLIDGGFESQGSPVTVTVRKCLPGTELEVAPVSFGATSAPIFDYVTHPADEMWNPGKIAIPEINIYHLQNAVVHGESGLITVGDILVRESLKLPSYEHFDIRWTGHDVMSLPQDKPSLTVGRGAHIFCGYPATRNYSHFIVDILSSALVPPLNNAFAEATPIMPPLLYDYQRDYMSHFPELFDHSIFLEGHTQAFCHELLFSDFGATNQHHYPHPYHATVMQFLRDRILAKNPGLEKTFPQKIYINRLDSAARRLLNETDVIECAEAHGFTSLSLSPLSVAEQVALFTNATHIIAPHGAGGTNILFCQPGTSFLELHLDHYIQWSMRRINSLVPIRYGCVIGRENGDEQQTWKRTWTIDIQELDATIGDMLRPYVSGRRPSPGDAPKQPLLLNRLWKRKLVSN
jgi:capsular polysaccharide biosynthesis protein